MTTVMQEVKPMTVEEFLNFNKSTQSYWDYWRWDKSEEENGWLKNERAIESAKKDLAIFEERLKAHESYKTPIEGHWIKKPDNTYTRLTHCWNDYVQDGGGQGSYYLCSNGKASYSGGLNHGAPYDMLELTEERKKGMFWIFHHGCSGASRGVDYSHACKVWRIKPLDSFESIKGFSPWDYPVLEVTEKLYDYALGVVPPISGDKFFAMGEAKSHTKEGQPVYYCFAVINGKYYVTIDTLERAKNAFDHFKIKII